MDDFFKTQGNINSYFRNCKLVIRIEVIYFNDRAVSVLPLIN